METLAKCGIIIVNFCLAIGALFFVGIASTIFGVVGFVLSVILSIVSSVMWFIIVSAYNKFMNN